MDDFINKLNRAVQVSKRLPGRAAVVAVNFSKERFIRKNWVESSRESWKPSRSRRGRGSTLVRSGRLKRSIRKVRVTQNYVIIGSDVPYAQIHNEGGSINKTVTVGKHQRRNSRGRNSGNITVKAHKRRMSTTIPKRQFIGESAVLARRIERMMAAEIKHILK